jgi:BirA family biotin operon repressor/biotin-[acetyl-CoA-carboxylase] ligase
VPRTERVEGALGTYALAWLERVTSTNDLLAAEVRSGRVSGPAALVAVEQTSGRGRRGARWESPPGGLWLSLAVPWGAPRGAESVAIALAVARWLREAWSVPASVKWPNDIWLGGSKLAGILPEARGGWLVAGIGLNVANPVPPGATRLADAGVAVEPAALAAPVLLAADAALARLREEGPAWLAGELAVSGVDALAGSRVKVGGVLGVARGVDGSGRLLIETKPGRLVARAGGHVEST